MPGDSDHIIAGSIDIITPEHVFANETTTLGNADLIGNVADMRVGKARTFTSESIHFLHHSLATFKFRIGKIIRIGRIDLPRYSLRRPPRQQYPPLTERMKKPTASTVPGMA